MLKKLFSFDVQPLLLISLDGFRPDYLHKRGIMPALARIAECGSSGTMYASYPSMTFPNHYTIVTGLYPEAHGIVDNNFFDNRTSEVV